MSEPADDPRLLELALQIADEAPVDWETARRTAPDLDADLEFLRALDRIAEGHRFLEPAAPEAEPVRFTWGSLRALEPLGEGGYGEVWRALDPALQREVALKLRREGAGASTTRWLDEARRLARIRHPHVLNVYGADVHEGRAGMWSELVRGHTLEALLRAWGPLGAREATLIGMDLCSALAAVHAAGLVHGDVKTGNVMREGLARQRGDSGSAGSAGRIVLMDFSSSQASLAEGAAAPTTTPLYAAPEVLAGGRVSVASDVHALGIVLYRLVTGEFPLEATSVQELLERMHAGERVPLRVRRPDLAANFIAVVERAIASDPAQRFADCGAMERALAAVVGSEVRAVASAVSGAWPRALAFVAGATLVAAAWWGVSNEGEWFPRLLQLAPGHERIAAQFTSIDAGKEVHGQLGWSLAAVPAKAGGPERIFAGSHGEGGTGSVHVYERGVAGPWRETQILHGERVNDLFGYAVADVGDLDGDGVHEVAITAYGVDGGAPTSGRVLIYHSGEGALSTPWATLDGVRSAAGFGYQVCAAGDLNGDGVGDLLVTSPGDDRGGMATGRVYVWFGGKTLHAHPDLELSSGQPGGQFGISAASLGDVNGDGYDDIAVGSNWARDGQHRRGRVDVFFGGPHMETTPSITLRGVDPDGAFGISVAGPGDLDGDGLNDMVVGADQADGLQGGSGAAYVYLSKHGFKGTPDLVLQGERSGEGFGGRVFALGDVDGDGAPDFAVSAPYADADAQRNGAVYVYTGGSALSSDPLMRIAGPRARTRIGLAAAVLPHAKGHYADLLLGAPFADEEQFDAGEVEHVALRAHAIQSPRRGSRLRAGESFELRWRGSAPADAELSSDGAHWQPLVHAAGGAGENTLRVAMPAGISGVCSLRLRPTAPAAGGVAQVDSLVVAPRP